MDEGLIRVFNKQGARTSLGTDYVGKKIYAYDLVTSTNDIALFLAQGGEPQGSVVFAKGQTQGRGRHGNAWVSPYGEGLYFSFILRPDFSARLASRVTLTVALALVRALEEVHAENVTIKWPNDIYLKEKKACGILTEMSLEGEEIKYIVVGIGVNVNAKPADLPDGSTSLKASCGRSFDIADLSHIIIKQVDRYYGLLLRHHFLNIIEEVRQSSGLFLGSRVRVTVQNRVVEGYAVDFDDLGALVIRRDNGMTEKVSAGHLIKL